MLPPKTSTQGADKRMVICRTVPAEHYQVYFREDIHPRLQSISSFTPYTLRCPIPIGNHSDLVDRNNRGSRPFNSYLYMTIHISDKAHLLDFHSQYSSTFEHVYISLLNITLILKVSGVRLQTDHIRLFELLYSLAICRVEKQCFVRFSFLHS